MHVDTVQQGDVFWFASLASIFRDLDKRHISLQHEGLQHADMLLQAGNHGMCVLHSSTMCCDCRTCPNTQKLTVQRACVEQLCFASYATLLNVCAYLPNRQCAAELVHGDVKLANVLVKDSTCRLADFGQTHSFGDPGQAGTPGHVAPEVLKGCVPGPESDLWSLGIFLATMLLGKLPFEVPTGRQYASGKLSRQGLAQGV